MTIDEQIKQTLLKHGYEYIEQIGRGGFSHVYLCLSRKYNQNFAVKRTIKSKINEYEYEALVSLVHPNIIKLYDFFSDDNSEYLVMEYCSNKTLKQKGRLNYDQFVYYAKQILDALNYCHSKKLAHRDIKPGNIFLDLYEKVKLADFGMSKICIEENKAKYMCGSLTFLSPEILESKEICPFKADIWALGITFYYMITGRLPFVSISIEEMKQFVIYGEISLNDYDVDPQIKYMIKKMTEKNQKNRPTAEQLLKLPIFSQNLNIKQNCFLYRNKSISSLKIAERKSMTLERDFKLKYSPVNNCAVSNIRSYKCDLFFPNVQKFNFHFK